MVNQLDISEGHKLSPVVKAITQDKIDHYANVSGDLNPLHIDPDFASNTPFGGTIAHGMLVLASLSELMEKEFQAFWRNSGRLKIRFRGAAKPGDTISASGWVKQVVDGRVVCHLECHNQDKEILINGEASVLFDGGKE
tara:strand:+ start:92 stop:508 length:417 start_codon:yes stop_codon:yes gene_type:complete